MGTNANNARADLQLSPSAGRRPPHGIQPDALPRALFTAEVVARALAHVVQDDFRALSSPATLLKLATPVLVRSDPDADEVEALPRRPGGELALLDTGYGHVRIEVASHTREAANAAARKLRAALETEPPVVDQVSMRGEFGGDV